jgi:3-deoxy-D-manno-octulosonic-acid transferase
MTRLLYTLLVWLAQPLLLRKLRKRARAEPGYGHAIAQRFGDYRSLGTGAGAALGVARQAKADAGAQAMGNKASPTTPSAQPTVWVHAVSLGEARAAAVLVSQLRVALPGMRLVLTHGTATGWEQGRALLQPGDAQVWLPWDTPGAVQRFLAYFQPSVGLLVETEVWPNLVHGCAQAGVPLCLVNARLSARSLRKAQRLAWLSRPAYAGLAAVWAQAEADAARLRQLGAPVRGVVGNLKFDAAPNPAQLQAAGVWRTALDKPVVLFASAREGEEQLWLDALKAQTAALQKRGAAPQAVQWLIVPRHPQRFDAVAALLEGAGMRVSRRSSWTGAPVPADVWLGDSLGEMALYFGMADVALLGGSFAPLGGQNLIEAAACGCPVVMGPHTFNFAQAAQMAQAAGAAFAVDHIGVGLERVAALLQSPTALAAARQSALRWSQSHRGAAAKTAAAVAALLQEKS